MVSLLNTSLEFQHTKCFGADPQGFQCILPINVIIGKNNAGKSTLLDLIQYATAPQSLELVGHHGGKSPQVILSYVVADEHLAMVPEHQKHEKFGNWRAFATTHGKGKRLRWVLGNQGHIGELSTAKDTSLDDEPLGLLVGFMKRFVGNPFSAYQFRRILADRDISPEAESATEQLLPNGRGATDILRRALQFPGYNKNPTKNRVLDALNCIFNPDIWFTDISVHQWASKEWEIHVSEARTGTIPLSHTGSGIKTVLLVLLNLLMIPAMTNKPLEQFIFGFEELEHSLHPTIQRKLLLFLRHFAIESRCTFFVTTHSSAAIDLFGDDPEAQILHVIHDGKIARVSPINTFQAGCDVVQDLGARASDLLQSNVVVWVEGPSDRIYFNRWIEIWSGGSLREYAHYQFLFTAGNLIAHLSYDDPDIVEQAIQALRVNRNAIVLLDRDRLDMNDPLKQNAQRVSDELKRLGGVEWVTAGREVENYIPTQAICAAFGRTDLKPVGTDTDLFSYLEQNGLGDFGRRKVKLAHRVSPHITREAIEKMGDMANKLDTVCEQLRRWNGLGA